MLFGKIIDYIIGKAVFEIYLSDPREAAVLDLLKKNGFYDCRVTGEKINLSCSCADAKVIDKTLSEMNIKHTFSMVGIPETVARLKKRSGIAFALAICLIINYFFSGMLWEINIVGNESVSENEIRSVLYSLGIYEGCRIKDINIPKLTMQYMLKDDRFSFVHLNINGTTGTFKVAERTKAPKKPDKKEVCNIVAKCDGIIERLDVYSGGREVENGQTVVKGQLLISSFFETRLSGHLLKRAKGTAYAKTFPSFEMYIPKKYVSENGNFKVYEKNTLSVLGLSILIDGANTVLDKESFDVERTKKQLSFFGIIPIPIFINTERFTVKETETKTRSQREAREMFDKSFSEWKSFFSESSEILSEEITLTDNGEAYIFIASLSCMEDIGVEKPFEIREN